MYELKHHVEVTGIQEVYDQLLKEFGPDQLVNLNRKIGLVIREKTSDHIARASVSRHKCADRLGARHTKVLEFAPARGKAEIVKGKNGASACIEDVSALGVSVVFRNAPYLIRGMRDVVVTPKRARALTIPIDKTSYGYSVRELKAKGHDIFRVKGTRILAETKGKGKKARLRALYCLTSRTVTPHDPGLLPSNDDFKTWALDTMEAFVESKLKK